MCVSTSNSHSHMDVESRLVSVLDTVYRLKLVFESGTAQEFKECITHARSIELFLRNIHTTQSSASILNFETSRDRMYALLLLSNDPLYTVRELD
jgi:hypothetical protein